jgi:hypothetical protein
MTSHTAPGQAADPRPSITCPECGATSWHPRDVADLYCGYCHWWTSDPVLRHCPPPDTAVLIVSRRRLRGLPRLRPA